MDGPYISYTVCHGYIIVAIQYYGLTYNDHISQLVKPLQYKLLMKKKKYYDNIYMHVWSANIEAIEV